MFGPCDVLRPSLTAPIRRWTTQIRDLVCQPNQLCSNRFLRRVDNLRAIASDLERQLNLKLRKDTPDLVRDLKDTLSRKRCLLILDNVENEDPGQLIPGGAASVLVTTRLNNLRFLRGRHPLNVPLFTEEQCFELFHRELGAAEVESHEPQCYALFERLGYGNQANILREQGRFYEALVLYTKKEKICVDLGNRPDLGYCYWKWGLLERALGHHQAAQEKLSAALAIFTELQMPRQRDQVQAELAKSRITTA
jgi:tetratricopeptide (TPR) repeat protein